MQSENYTISDDLGKGDAIGNHPKIEANIQSIVLKKTFESISFDRRRDIEEEDGHK